MVTSLTKFKGGKEMQEMLNTLPAKMESNIMRSALRAGAAVILQAARANINDDTGHLSRSLRVSTRSRRGEVAAKLSTNVFYAPMVEFGTLAHWISVREEARPSRMTRRGKKTYSIGTLNKMAKRGSLKIGENFVGESVHHPGAAKKPFMRKALDEKQAEAIRAVGEQVRKRLTQQGLNTPDALQVDDE